MYQARVNTTLYYIHITIIALTCHIYIRQDQWIGFYPSDDSDLTAEEVADRRVGWAWLDGSDGTWETWKGNEPTLNDGCARLHEDDGKLMLIGKECTQLYY